MLLEDSIFVRHATKVFQYLRAVYRIYYLVPFLLEAKYFCEGPKPEYSDLLECKICRCAQFTPVLLKLSFHLPILL